MKTLFVLVLLHLSACSRAPSEIDRRRQSDSEIATLDRAGLDSQLAATRKDLEALAEELVAARARRDSRQIQASTDLNKQNAVDGVEAEIESLQQRLSLLMHRQHSLEARGRELNN